MRAHEDREVLRKVWEELLQLNKLTTNRNVLNQIKVVLFFKNASVAEGETVK